MSSKAATITRIDRAKRLRRVRRVLAAALAEVDRLAVDASGGVEEEEPMDIDEVTMARARRRLASMGVRR